MVMENETNDYYRVDSSSTEGNEETVAVPLLTSLEPTSLEPMSLETEIPSTTDDN